MKDPKSKNIIDEYQLLRYIYETSNDRTVVHIWQRFQNLKRMIYGWHYAYYPCNASCSCRTSASF